MSQRYNGNTKKTKAERKSARDLKYLRIMPDNSAEGLESRWEHGWGYYLRMSIHPKSCRVFPLNVDATLRSDSWKGAVGVSFT